MAEIYGTVQCMKAKRNSNVKSAKHAFLLQAISELTKNPCIWMIAFLKPILAVSEICTPAYQQIHIKAMHEGKREFKCEICKTCFSSPSHLKTYNKTAHLEENYKCEICSLTFTFAVKSYLENIRLPTILRNLMMY